MSEQLLQDANAALAGVFDPEIPVITIAELGVLRGVAVHEGALEVTITPTYSGCPAMAQIQADVRAALAPLGCSVRVHTQLSPAWTTDWMSEATREKLRAYGIAPPGAVRQQNTIQFATKTIAALALSTAQNGKKALESSNAVRCPQCDSENTTEVSHFASTACKAHYKCLSCMEPFDHFKPY